jgi:hypothetical protein
MLEIVSVASRALKVTWGDLLVPFYEIFSDPSVGIF